MIPTRFLVPRRTQESIRVCEAFVYRACTFFGWPFNAIQLNFINPTSRPYNPKPKLGLGSSRFARHYSGNHSLFSFPLATKMFQFARLPHHTLCIHVCVVQYYLYWVAPFGYLRIFVYVPLPEAFRC